MNGTVSVRVCVSAYMCAILSVNETRMSAENKNKIYKHTHTLIRTHVQTVTEPVLLNKCKTE